MFSGSSYINVSLTLDANCSRYMHKDDEEQLKSSLVISIANVLKIEPRQIEISAVKCGKIFEF